MMKIELYIDDDTYELLEMFGNDVELDVDHFIQACVNTYVDEFLFGCSPILVGDSRKIDYLHLWKFRMNEGDRIGTAHLNNLNVWDYLTEEQKTRFEKEAGWLDE